jgi:predicted aldo/keto reductase-like oxidoreductase
VVNTIRLGKTNLMVSALGFGGIPIQRLTEEEAIRVVQHCMDLGVTFVDTAHGYTTSEERVGKAIAGRREGLVLATKSHALDGKSFREELEQSFQRLGVQYIDLVQFHNISNQEQYEQVTAPGGPLEVLREVQAAGRVGHIGVTSHNLDMALKMVPSGHFETLMFPFCLATTEPADEIIPLCRQHDVGFIAMKPMGGGLLEDATLAFKYLRKFPDILPLVGMQSISEVEQNVALMEGLAEISAAEQAEMDRIRQEMDARYCRGCDYCQPCTQGISISTVMRLRSFAKRFPVERFLGDWGQSLIAKAETCADCGDCESRCPYELAIREMMRENVAWYHEQMALYRK